MADLLGFLSALVVVGCILLVAGLITRFGVAPREAILHRDHFVRQGIPSQAMIGVKNPFSLEVKSIRSCPEIEKKGDILLLLNNEVPCRVTLYWEVNKDSLTAAISQDESETASSFDHHSEINDPELRELPSMSTIPLEHILDGCYEDRDPSEFYDSAPDHEIVAKLPPNMEANLETKSSLVSYTSSKHSLVITVEMSRKDEMCPQQLSEIVALITAVQVSKSKTSQPVCSITMQCVQTAEGKLYSLKKLFVVESDNPLETETALRSPSSSSPTDGNLNTRSSDPMNTMCIVCSALPVSRAFLPCRHACVCGLCFSHLNCCPMCRGLIHSYFKVQEEPYIKNAEFDSSTELNNMSVGELLRGVWSAS